MAEVSHAPDTAGLDYAHSGLNRILRHNDALFAVGLAVVLATLLIPLPTFLMDLLLACSISISLATLVIVLSSKESIEFSSFPSLLLLLTLFRLSLNVASTRLILLNANAGQIISTFGNFVVGGNMVIGLVVFLILVVIQFVVITKGSERISEVAARFNLDAMPGKQMAIDADLSSGIIGDVEARGRRAKIVRESEFYGAMDGASKFIRGDAIACLLICAINLIGGFVIGMMRGMSPADAIKTYSILGIGDGLVSQIPAVIISTSAGFLISKTSTQSNLSTDLIRQMLLRSRPLAIVSVLLGAMAFVPGFPAIPFLVIAASSAGLSRILARQEKQTKAQGEKAKPEKDPEQAPAEEFLDVDKLSLQVGAKLIRTVDPKRKNSLSGRIVSLRREFAKQWGMVLPLVRLRDNVALELNAYEIRLSNHVIASGTLEPDMFLAMDGGMVTRPVQGTATQEPVFNLPALWIRAEQKEQAELAGYTVVDPESVLITHLSETLKKHAGELLSRDDAQKLVDRLKERQPALVSSVIGDLVSLGLLHRVLQNLLRAGIPIRDLAQILEALSDQAGRTKDPGALTEFARKALVRTISEQFGDGKGNIHAIVLETGLEYELRNSMRREGDSEVLTMIPERAVDLVRKIAEAWKAGADQGHDKIALLCEPRLRPQMAAMLARQLPQVAVLSYDELATGVNVEPVATVTLPALPAPRMAEELVNA